MENAVLEYVIMPQNQLPGVIVLSQPLKSIHAKRVYKMPEMKDMGLDIRKGLMKVTSQDMTKVTAMVREVEINECQK